LDLPKQHCNVGGENPTPEHPACLMCERSWAFKKQEDRVDEICKILKDNLNIPRLKVIHIQGVAEPFWKDRIFDVLDAIGVTPYTCVSTATNGTILNEEIIRRYFEYPRSNTSFSVDAATPETYRKLRRLDYNKVVENLMLFSEWRTPRTQGFFIHNNINLLNIEEVEGMVRLAASVKADFVDFDPTYELPGLCVDENNFPLFKQAEERILRAAKEVGIRATFMRKLTLDYEKRKIYI
jgi:MoaA/NifB/PqqE/SkfB family radical SAM enzyme